jgi:hypothetical protein
VPDPATSSTCQGDYIALGGGTQAWSYSPEMAADGTTQCHINDPVASSDFVAGVSIYTLDAATDAPVNGSCRLAQALLRAMQAAQAAQGSGPAVVSLIYSRAYECEAVNGQLTSHGLGDAIDILGVQLDGSDAYMVSDWATDTTTRTYLSAFAVMLVDQHIFNNVLTPEQDSGTYGDHIHADLGTGAQPVRDLLEPSYQLNPPGAHDK